MKNSLVLLILFFCCCKHVDPIAAALSTKGKTAKIISVQPCTSRAPDSIDMTFARREYEFYLRLAKESAYMEKSEYTQRIDSLRGVTKFQFDSLYNVFLSKSTPDTGYYLCVFTFDRDTDRRFSVLNQNFEVIWPR